MVRGRRRRRAAPGIALILSLARPPGGAAAAGPRSRLSAPPPAAFCLRQQAAPDAATSLLEVEEDRIQFEIQEADLALPAGDTDDDEGLDSADGGYDGAESDDGDLDAATVAQLTPPSPSRATTISPSLLACDWSCIREEVQRCLRAGADRFHVDVFDGVFLDAPRALTFGPQMVTAIRRSCQGRPVVLDLHLCVDRPARYVAAMADAGASRFIFSWESVGGLDEAIDLAFEVASSGMACGVSINPSTNVEEIYPLLETNMVDCVNVLAVEPGFGGQRFQRRALESIARLRALRNLSMIEFDIMVDGGINHETAGEAAFAGADVLVSGSFLFGHPGGVGLCILDLLSEVERFAPIEDEDRENIE